MDGIKEWLSSIIGVVLKWLFDWVAWLPEKFYQKLCEKLADWIVSISPPEVVQTAANLLAQWGPTAGWFFDIIEFNWGFSLIMSSITIKWIWRKIPFFGRGM